MNNREHARFWRDSTLSNLELLHATYVTHTFAPHTHEGFAIGVIEHGAEAFTYRRNTHVAAAGNIVVINPGEMHTGSAAVEQGWTYRMLYPPAYLLQRAASEITRKQRDIPFFPSPIVSDSYLAAQIALLHRAFEENAPLIERETRLLWTFAQLVVRHADDRPALNLFTKEYGCVQKVRAYIEDHYAENVSLEQLALIANLSPFHLLRTFRNVIGLPPHAYLMQVRVMKAKHLLIADMPITDAALLVGFADQSHFTKHFKRIVGVPPGLYMHSSKK